MLKTCPECELQVSDKAASCPHCGYPINSVFQKSQPRKNSRKHRRLPNGFGQITEIKNKNLRKPFRVMVTVGKDEYCKPICKLLKPEAYFATYNEAYTALLVYNKNPYEIDSNITMDDLFKRWASIHFSKDKNDKQYKNALCLWEYCSCLYDMPVNTVRIKHLRSAIYNATATRKEGIRKASDRTKNRIKSILNLMFDYAVEYELTDRNYARDFAVSKDVVENISEPEIDHIAFTDDELRILEENINDETAKMILIQCYSGWRPSELVELKVENINLESMTITGGMKTPAGENRIVPIHDKIKDPILDYLKIANELDSPWLFPDKKNQTNHISYFQYRNKFNSLCLKLNINDEHRPHDPRKTFVTLAKRYNVDEYAIKRLVGHKIDDLTERVYTVRDVNWLRDEMKKIK